MPYTFFGLPLADVITQLSQQLEPQQIQTSFHNGVFLHKLSMSLRKILHLSAYKLNTWINLKDGISKKIMKTLNISNYLIREL